MIFILIPLILIFKFMINYYLTKKYNRIEYENSILLKIYISIFTTIPDLIEASLLTILITNYLFWE